jgi:hypothetical protein
VESREASIPALPHLRTRGTVHQPVSTNAIEKVGQMISPEVRAQIRRYFYVEHSLRRAIAEALERSTPRSASVAFLLRREPRLAPLTLDLSRHPQAQALDVRPHDLETYDELAQNKNNSQ